MGDLAEVTARAEAVRDARSELDARLRELRETIKAADQEGCGRNQIVAAAKGGLSRAMVYETLGAADLLAEVRETLRAAGIPAGDSLTYPSRHVMLTEHAGKVQVMIRWGDEKDMRLSDQRDREMAANASKVLEAAGLTVPGDMTKGRITVGRRDRDEREER